MTVDRRAPRPPRHPDDRFLRHWVPWVTLGESVGFLAPALAQLAFAGTPVAVPALILAGALEGAVLGWTQATVLRVLVPALNRPRWVAATAIAASAAWFIGLLPAEWADVWQRWPAAGQAAAGVVGALLLLSALGIAQWTELRRHSRSAGWWVPGSAAAWGTGLVVFFAVATPLWQPGQAAALVLLIGVFAGILMALSMAVVSGLVIIRIVQSKSPSQPT